VRPGRRLGVDVGSVRVGVAASDREGLLATPVETLRRDLDGQTDLLALRELAREHDVVEIVVGLPRSLSGGEGPAAGSAREYADQLAAAVAPIPVRLVDERLTTVSAHQQLRRSGVRERQGRAVVDQVAAVVILQHALDSERASGRPPGEPVPVPPA
jgi:putative Holliday junction resolvase